MFHADAIVIESFAFQEFEVDAFVVEVALSLVTFNVWGGLFGFAGVLPIPILSPIGPMTTTMTTSESCFPFGSCSFFSHVLAALVATVHASCFPLEQCLCRVPSSDCTVLTFVGHDLLVLVLESSWQSFVASVGFGFDMAGDDANVNLFGSSERE